MKQYYIIIDGQQTGPVDEAVLQADAAAGKYAAGTLIWCEDMAGWEPIEKHFKLPVAPPPLPAATPPPLPSAAPPPRPAAPAAKTTQPGVPYTYVEALYSCVMRWRNFEGRSSKAECWKYFLWMMLSMLLWTVAAPLLVLVVYPLVICVPMMAVSVRRMHDIGKPGWYAWIPFYGTILALQDSQVANEYGEAPLKPEPLPSTLEKYN